ncbi:uncharacterized protein LOC143567290 [Bidens hawaiensis]|uniref:uncharacterized protein LOC143567290 n=1 Tax=Bidens hawaiensis TaxID=980011 RepID=UPI00404943F0
MPNMIIGDHPHRARRRHNDCECEQGEARLMKDYFVDNPTYDQDIFQRRFRMRKPLFLCIVDEKCTRAIRALAYGISADAQDEYLRMSDPVTRNSVIKFAEGVVSCFSQEYLRRP